MDYKTVPQIKQSTILLKITWSSDINKIVADILAITFFTKLITITLDSLEMQIEIDTFSPIAAIFIHNGKA